jgi:hypothetical protein
MPVAPGIGLRAIQHLGTVVADVADGFVGRDRLHRLGVLGAQQGDRQVAVSHALRAAGITG